MELTSLIELYDEYLFENVIKNKSINITKFHIHKLSDLSDIYKNNYHTILHSLIGLIKFALNNDFVHMPVISIVIKHNNYSSSSKNTNYIGIISRRNFDEILKKSIKYFESIEEYELCVKVLELINIDKREIYEKTENINYS